MKNKIWVSTVVIVFIVSFIPIIVEIAPTVEAPAVLEVDDSGGKPYTSIQAAVDDAQPGDTVFVYAGTYYEDVVIDKTLNLTGEDRDSTVINATSMGISVEYVYYVNISGFKIENGSGAGIRFNYSNNSLINNCKIRKFTGNFGIFIRYSNNCTIQNNILINNSGASGIRLWYSNDNEIKNNICINNYYGIYLREGSSYNTIVNNNCSFNKYGIYISHWSDNNIILNNFVSYNTGSLIGESGFFMVNCNNNTIINISSNNNRYGFNLGYASSNTNYISNSSIRNSENHDIRIGDETEGILINTTFNKSAVTFYDTLSSLEVKWFIHIKVLDYLGNPIPNVKVKIEDNGNGTYNKTYITNGDGYVKWIPATEYIERDPDGDTIGEKTYYTSHRIIAWNDTLVGYANLFVNESKTITIILYNGTLLDLNAGWNLISLPRIQADINLQTVLQSVENQYDAVQQYNVTDANDPWKHYHISKPTNLNDLHSLDHTKGFWLHVIDPQGTTLVVFGDELITNQSISIYSGWNLVGYPSLVNRTRDAALNNINFSLDVDSIWTFNATEQRWYEIKDFDYFAVGKGYWIHSKSERVWDVPL